jgi:hypothetical protein
MIIRQIDQLIGSECVPPPPPPVDDCVAAPHPDEPPPNPPPPPPPVLVLPKLPNPPPAAALPELDPINQIKQLLVSFVKIWNTKETYPIHPLSLLYLY